MEANAIKVVQATRGRIRSLFRRTDLSIRLRLIGCFVLIVLLMIAADAVAANRGSSAGFSSVLPNTEEL
jgi:hypothetical protein